MSAPISEGLEGLEAEAKREGKPERPPLEGLGMAVGDDDRGAWSEGPTEPLEGGDRDQWEMRATKRDYQTLCRGFMKRIDAILSAVMDSPQNLARLSRMYQLVRSSMKSNSCGTTL